MNIRYWHYGAVSRNTSFSLDKRYCDFIEHEVTSGRYRPASEVVHTALRLLEVRETQSRAGCDTTMSDKWL